ncbi:MAG: D-alanyl-D-alanine carboxypeptidase family protein [Bacilli bacterium]
MSLRKKCQSATLVFALVCSLIAGAQPKEARELQTNVSAETAVLMEQSSGRVLYSKNMHKPRKIASITKIMTAILAIESGRMDEIVKITPTAVRTEGSSIYLRSGQEIKLESLVYGLMLRSGNDAANAIAEFVGGSQEGFVYMMNEKAAEIGMEHTQFANPSGLDAGDKHYSSAYDMALLTRYAMHNPMYRKISSTKTYPIPADDGRMGNIWVNKNKMLTQFYKYSTGGKTGFTRAAGRTLVSTAAKNDMELIVVTLNGPDDWRDHMSLFEQGFKTYHLETIVKAGRVPGTVTKFAKYGVYVRQPFVYPLAKDEGKHVAVHVKLVNHEAKYPYRPGSERVGEVNVTLYDEPIGNVGIYRYSAPESFGQRLASFFFAMLGVI